MRILYFDAFSGVSGDMTVGALLSLGVDLAFLESELSKLPFSGYRLGCEKRRVGAIPAVKFDVVVDGTENPEHRRYRDIRAAIEDCRDLAAPVKEKALAVFARLAEVEGAVHGVAPDDVEFHEVGAIDSIVDVVATAAGLVNLGIDRVFVSILPLGSGVVRSRHGPIPVPAPATVELLQGFRVRAGDGEGELVTPTGAAIVAALASPGVPPAMRVEAVGYGAGSRKGRDRPNVLRLTLGSEDRSWIGKEMLVLEANVDDSNPEIYDYVMQRLFGAGARDVWLEPIQMKKNRPGTLLRVVADPVDRDTLAQIILTETSTTGLRWHTVGRIVLQREVVTVETELGPVEVKVAEAPDGSRNIAPEYESCRRVASERGVALKLVYEAAVVAFRGSAGK